MLNDYSDQDEKPMGMGKAEKCKPDYEGMIKRISKKTGRAVAFRDAALSYFDDRKAGGKMAELIGELVTECNKLHREHDRLIEAQEKDKSE